MTSKKINTSTDYTKLPSEYQLSMAFDLPLFIPKNDPVRLLKEILEGLNYTKLKATYSTKGRNSAIPPVIMFKILVYAYMNRAYSSRDIARLCRRDINFIWLLQGFEAPSHHTISRFRSERLADEVMEDLFSQLVELLFKLDEITFQTLFIDGTKVEANANRYSFVWMRAVSKFQLKLYEKIEKFLPVYKNRYAEIETPEGAEIIDVLKEMEGKLSKLAEKDGLEFVHGKGKRKKQLQRDIETVKEWLEKEERYQEYAETAGQRNSFSKTDKEATFMRLKDDHMKNGQLKPAYNVQIGVDSEYIVHVGLFQNANDLNTLKPYLTSMSQRLNRKYKNIVADAGYESEENYAYLKDEGYVSYIKPTNYAQTKTKKFKNQIGRRENMSYDPVTDTYTCANGKVLSAVGTKTQKSKTGYERIVTTYECEGCQGCPLRSKCTKAKLENNKKLDVSKKMLEYREESFNNITTEEGSLLRMNRSIQVEGAFGVLKEDYGFRKFLTRGKSKTSVEFLLLSFAYNINKLHNKIQNGRCGQHLHEKKIA